MFMCESVIIYSDDMFIIDSDPDIRILKTEARDQGGIAFLSVCVAKLLSFKNKKKWGRKIIYISILISTKNDEIDI